MPSLQGTVNGHQQHPHGSGKRSKRNKHRGKKTKPSPPTPVLHVGPGESRAPDQSTPVDARSIRQVAPPAEDPCTSHGSSACSSPILDKLEAPPFGVNQPRTSMVPGDCTNGEVLTYSYIQMAPTLICQQERKVPHQRSVCTVGTQTETTTQDQLQVKSVTPSTGAATQNILQTFIDQLIKEKKCFDPVHLSIQDELDTVKSSIACTVCLSTPASILFLSCSHLVCCVSCSGKLATCPVCRSIIRSRLQVYMI